MSTTYALLMMSVPDDQGHNALEDFGRNNLTWVGTLDQVLDADRHLSWKEELGRSQWNRLMTGHRFYLVHSEALPHRTGYDQLEAPDKKSEIERRSVWRAALPWHAIQLSGLLTPFSGTAYLLSGEAESVSLAGVQLRTLSTYQQLEPVKWPMYSAQEDFEKAHPPQNSDPWFERWRDMVQLLDGYGPAGLPRLLNVAIHAFERGMQRSHLESKLPELVLAAEVILALPRGKAVKEFAPRSLQLVPTLRSLPYLQSAKAPMFPKSHGTGLLYQLYNNVNTTDIERWLYVLYGHRSDCVHGKVPFEELTQSVGSDVESARFDYLAETMAREAICYVLKNPGKFPEFKDRATLEDAWAQKRFP